MKSISKKANQWSWIFVFALVLILAGCGNKSETFGVPSSNNSTPKNQVATVGLDNCTQCHFENTEMWLTGAHGNLEAINHSTHQELDLGLNSDGFPYYGYFTDATCAGCHDQLGDGRRLIANYTGNVPRPVIGCESCHGGGAEHFGAGEIPYPAPGPERCGQCHSASFPDGHLLYHPNGKNILEEYSTSPHADSINEHTLVAGDSTSVKATCSRCHTDQGFRTYAAAVPGSTGYLALTGYFRNLPSQKNASEVQCSTCHDSHTASKQQLAVINGSTVAGKHQSSEFNTCTDCHQITGADGKVLSGSTYGAYHDPAANPHGDSELLLARNHAAGAADTRFNTGADAQALYFVNKGDDQSCAGCHNPHSADLTINKQYAESGHGDPLDDPWVHYNWKADNRGACQRCHTSTGFKNYANSLINGTPYDYHNNNFSYLAGNGASDANRQMETLYCWACHTDYKGGLREPPAIIAPYKAMDGSTVEFPDVSGSNVCMSCHTGREGGGSVANSKADFSNTGFINSHYLTAGAIVFDAGGYQFPGRDYANTSHYEHDIIGLPEAGATVTAAMGNNGPCVGCHMHSNPEKHLFEPVSKDGDTVLALTSTGCAACHSGNYQMTTAKLLDEREMFRAAMEALNAQLKLKGFCFSTSNPYFFTTASGCKTAVKDWTNGVLANGKPNMGACFNYNLLEHDPGAYAHNRYYEKRLIYDSIDWIDDYTLNGSVYGTLNALDPATSPYKQAAMGYLLKGSTNTTADRP